MWRTGSSTTAASGSRASTGSASTCAPSKPRKVRRRRAVAARSSAGAPMTERTVVITRIFDAPRELVFEAWINPMHLAAWFGPKGFTNPVCEVDLRIGGKLRIVMRAPDGTQHPMIGIFREIVRPERLVFTNIATDVAGKI